MADASPQETFEAYRVAVMQGNGGPVGTLVTAETRAFYDRVRALALAGDVQALEASPLVEALLAVRLRAAFTRQELQGLDGGGVIGAAVAGGLVGSGLSSVSLGPAEVYGDHALAEQVDASGAPTGVWWRFINEGGAWRIDLRPNLEAGEALLRDRLHASGLTRAEFLTTLATDRR